ncbi:uncharacterized protein SOCE26_079010 [Sorangium cellulosum]|uniref:Uncharacterized protein n=1 Tax=Sorangium cellulosum TaxID=56 RepID=A0A2L0F499_SORCE|nr:hypothetical protein [Sorangium cellulosum]AUX46380.1 uncharacterized protein SOCE26_078860 [Sorangium cellulosum]AUX46395.1 uncharacterized protein SOCE26_079010 [Sorangium cellulosum]
MLIYDEIIDVKVSPARQCFDLSHTNHAKKRFLNERTRDPVAERPLTLNPGNELIFREMGAELTDHLERRT